MHKILGSFFILLLNVFCITMQAAIRLEVRTDEAMAQNTVLVGQPFSIEVIIDEVQGSVQPPHIEGLDAMNAKRVGMYMSSINGVSTIKYTYQARIDQEGKYVIGPARLTYRQQEMVSNSVSIVVDKASNVSLNATKNKKTDSKAFLRLTTDVDHVVVGQKIVTTLRFYYQDQALSLVNIGIPDIPGFDVKTAEKPVGGSTTLHGVHYKYAEWQWNMYPTHAGECVIPAYNVDYELPAKDTRIMRSFFMFMNARSERKRVYSNVLKIMVDPLPHHHEMVNAIGLFEDFHVSITPPVAKEGEGMVLTWNICGNGNMDALMTPTLNIPSTLKSYDSHSVITKIEGRDDWFSKKFEFIVQGMQVGDWEVPEQEFVYFDINKQEYVILKSSPLSVSIQPSGHVHSVAVKKDDVDVHQNTISIAPLHQMGPWYPVSDGYEIPWIIFYCMFCMPLVYIGYPIVGKKLQHISHVKRWNQKKACKDARKKIHGYMNDFEDKYLYTTIMELFSVLMERSPEVLSQEMLEDYLRKQGCFEDTIVQWRMFFSDCVHAAYAQSKGQSQELCRTAIQWLKYLEQSL